MRIGLAPGSGPFLIIGGLLGVVGIVFIWYGRSQIARRTARVGYTISIVAILIMSLRLR